MALIVADKFKKSSVKYRMDASDAWKTIARLGEATQGQLRELQKLNHPAVSESKPAAKDSKA